ncbi:hypothetical protein PP298_04635 [Mycobacteroides abscessus]|uniref:hypothetical protein n=1 Tax=Mycobacteroides abscessus TaxID=36809 RepID=UPI00078C11B1|nr:hypothetical protein [Mycobacteroides abscessus]AMU69546.1 hypothetical protein A3O05_05380 [Mycobacteroides abscessus]MDM2014626.1 hypothetical protein [Mycobacteroides abscessus]MDM2020267.1 hypothetical protein [Mycobacteroides abscessus]MDM2023914.1 hypothetical protein [Mycobacteroides abscessus]MDM2028815.1 hypothetical protein [Mycobacteroides abscessus]
MTVVANSEAVLDSESRRPLRFGVAYGNWVWTDGLDDLVRVRAVDLRDLARKVAAVRDDAPHAGVVVDIDVIIAADAPSARGMVSDSGYPAGDTLLYVGTPAGLCGLIADIHTLGIADGAILVPLDYEGVVKLVYDTVVPELRAMAAV